MCMAVSESYSCHAVLPTNSSYVLEVIRPKEWIGIAPEMPAVIPTVLLVYQCLALLWTEVADTVVGRVSPVLLRQPSPPIPLPIRLPGF